MARQKPPRPLVQGGRRRTSALRIALAVLAASLVTPLAFALLSVIVALVESAGAPGSIAPGDLAFTVLFVWATSLLIVSPLTLGLIVFPLSPFWFLHHRAGGGPWSFLVGGAGAGLILGLIMLSVSAEAASAEAVLTVLVFTLTALVTTALIWRIAYGPFAGVNSRRLSSISAQPVA